MPHLAVVASGEQFHGCAQQERILTECGAGDFDHATDARGGMGVEGTTNAAEELFAGAKEAAKDQRVWLEGVDVPGSSGPQPATDFGIDLRGYSVAGLGFFGQQLQAEALAIVQPTQQAGLLTTAQSALERLLEGIKGNESIDATALAAATAWTSAGDGQMADVPYVFLGCRLDLAVDD